MKCGVLLTQLFLDYFAHEVEFVFIRLPPIVGKQFARNATRP